MIKKKNIVTLCFLMLPMISFSQEVLANTTVEANTHLKMKKAERLAKAEEVTPAPPASVPVIATEEKPVEEVKVATPQEITLTTEDLDPQTKFDIESIKAFLTSFNDIVVKKDSEKITSFFNEKFVVVRSDQTAFNSKESLSNYFFEASAKNSKLIDVMLEEKINVVFSRNIQNAAVIGKGLEVFNIAGQDVEIPIRWTATLEKVDGSWKFNSLHFAANYLDNKILSSYDETSSKYGLIGLFVGLFLGLIFVSLIVFGIKKLRK